MTEALPRIGLVQMEVKPGRPDLNAASMLRYIGEARRRGARWWSFPSSASAATSSAISGRWTSCRRLRRVQRGHPSRQRGDHHPLRQRRHRPRPHRRGRPHAQVQRRVRLQRRRVRRPSRPAGGVAARSAAEDVAPQLPLLRRRPALLLAAQASRRGRALRVRLDGSVRGGAGRREALRFRRPVVRGHLVPGLQLRRRHPRHPRRLPRAGGAGRLQPLLLPVDLAQERQAQPRCPRHPEALAASLLLRQPGRSPEQRQEHHRLRRGLDLLRQRRQRQAPGAPLEGGGSWC